MTKTVAAAQDARSLLIGTGLLFTGGLLIGLAPIGLRFAVADGLGPQATAFWRFLLALPMIFLLFIVRNHLPKKPNIWAILAGVFFALDIGLWHLALTITSVANATFIVNVGSICVGFLAWIFLKDRPSVFWGMAVVLTLAGAWMLSTGGQSEGGSGNLRGDLLAVGAAVFVSLYFLCGKIARQTLGALDVLFWATFAMIPVVGLVGIAFGDPLIPADIMMLKWPFWIAVLSHIGGQGLIIAGLGRAPASVAGVMIVIQPVAAAMISWPLFGEKLALMQLAGAGLILSGIVVAQIRTARPKLQPEAA